MKKEYITIKLFKQEVENIYNNEWDLNKWKVSI